MHIWDPRFSEAEKEAIAVITYDDLIKDEEAAVAKLLKDGEL